MKISTTTLNKLIKSPDNIIDLTNKHITEIEDIRYPVVIDNLVTGYVEECVDHENSDHLHVTSVNIGLDKPIQIVCGAKNIKKGLYVIVALPGCRLPEMEIKESKVRGVSSNGMICSLDELGIPNNIDGIYSFKKEVKLGINPIDLLQYNDIELELSITPNRSDLLSYIGFARDISAITKTKLIKQEYKINFSNIKNPMSVKIDTNNCSYYSAAYAEVKVMPSPEFIQIELLKNNINPKNNIVDISNYVMLMYGCPNHMFDYNLFNSNEIVIKDGFENYDITTLDDTKLKLQKDDVVITDSKDPKALAGIMGLSNSMINDNTSKIIIEFANFNPKAISNTSKRCQLSTDSSDRFSKYVDTQDILEAQKLAFHLLSKYADAKIASDIKVDKKVDVKPKNLVIDLKYIKKLIGSSISKDKIFSILKWLNFNPKFNDKTKEFKLEIPTYRSNDVKIKADIVEEILRIYGFDNIKSKDFNIDFTPKNSSEYEISNYFRNILSNLGLHETISYSLVDNSNSYINNLEDVKVLHPRSETHAVLRKEIITSIYERYLYNYNRKNKFINLFEIGHIFSNNLENNHLSVLLSSKLISNAWQKDNTLIDFYYIKGLLENILSNFDINLLYVESNYKNLHPYRQAYIYDNDNLIGIIGQIFDQKYTNNPYVFEIDIDYLINKHKDTKYQKISKFPNVMRDISFIIKNDTKLTDIEYLIKQTARKYLTNLELFDVYVDSNNQRSLAYRLTFNDSQKTLESSDIDKVIKSIFNRLQFEHGCMLK